MKKFIIIVSVFLFRVGFITGQDVQFTQFYAAPLYLNPAFTGANTCARTALLYRNQWRGVSQPYQSMLFSFDHYFFNQHIGAGVVVVRDFAGSGGFKTVLIKPSIAYGARMNKHYELRFGLQPGIGIKSVDYSNLLFGDQIYRGGNSVPTVEPPVNPKTYFDLNAGILLAGRSFWGGISVFHLNMPDESLYGGIPVTLPMQFSFHAGVKIDLNKEERDVYRKKSITPVFHFRAQNKFDQADIGFYVTRYIFSVGAWYRGLPVLKAYKKGYQNNDAVAFIAGIQTERIKVGYSFDYTISELGSISKGAHEISLSFQLCNPKKRKTKFALISCPKF